MSRASSWLLYSLPVVVGCGAAIEPVTSTNSFATEDASVTVPDTAPLGGTDAGVSQIPPVLNTFDAASPAGGDAGSSDTCEIHTIQSTPSIPDMMIVLDRSGSMNKSASSPTDRWGGSRRAITDVAQRYDDDIRFGLLTFPEFTADNSASQCATGTVNVPVGLQTGDQIALTLQGMTAHGYTPTSTTLDVARSTLGPVASDPDIRMAPKYVLLVTDGDPNCSTSDGSGSAVDLAARDASIAAIEGLASDGIKTYVVGFETAGTLFEDQLDLMAQAGDTQALKHRSVSSGDDLALALKEVIAQVTSCVYALNEPVVDESYVEVKVDSKTRALGRVSDGFSLGKDKQTVTLTGQACTDIKNGATLEIKVVCVPVHVN